jgi:uncharacterized protein (DUF2141 family)
MTRPLILASLLALAAASTQAASLEVTIHGLKQNQGFVMLALYDQGSVWLRGKPLKATRISVSADGSLTHVFDDLPEDSDVALSVFHDVNGNGRMDTNPMGMPIEPYGFSNDAVGHFGPPKFEAARLKVNGAVKTTLTLN